MVLFDFKLKFCNLILIIYIGRETKVNFLLFKFNHVLSLKISIRFEFCSDGETMVLCFLLYTLYIQFCNCNSKIKQISVCITFIQIIKFLIN